ncbi:MAG: hypothetical protein DRH08_04190 [Deltaproteobacteria bacterium]|nr:MAG: hypothetical protein DRH08_04190 [Deltaproteobacteria bacterium]
MYGNSKSNQIFIVMIKTTNNAFIKDRNSLHLRYLLIFLMISYLAFNPGNAHALMIEDIDGTERTLRIAGAKLAVSDNIDTNIASIKKAIDFAREEGADILLTPEGSLSGYTTDFDSKKAEEGLEEILEYARKAKIGLALGTCFYEADGKCYNQVRFYDKMGSFLGFHSKILLCGNHNDPDAGEINDFASSHLRTFEFEGVTIGGLICNDMWSNPMCTTLHDSHLSQQLSKMGAQVIFHAVNGGRDDSEWAVINWNFHASNLRMRASSGGIWIVTADNSYPENLNSSSPSGVVDPDGNWACATKKKGVQYFTYTIELDD